MLTEEIESLAALLREACEHEIARGFLVCSGDAGSGDYCPLGAAICVLPEAYSRTFTNARRWPMPERASQVLGIPFAVARAFMGGFGADRSERDAEPDAYDLGSRFRRWYDTAETLRVRALINARVSP